MPNPVDLFFVSFFLSFFFKKKIQIRRSWLWDFCLLPTKKNMIMDERIKIQIWWHHPLEKQFVKNVHQYFDFLGLFLGYKLVQTVWLLPFYSVSMNCLKQTKPTDQQRRNWIWLQVVWEIKLHFSFFLPPLCFFVFVSLVLHYNSL